MGTASGQNDAPGTEFNSHSEAIADASRQALETRIPILKDQIGGGQHVLYVDDEEAIGLLVRRMLTRNGFRASVFDRPDVAVAAFMDAPGSFDIVVTDQNMPGASGLDVAREIRRVRPDMPIAIVSGVVSDELVRNATAIGVTSILCKPSTIEELCESIARLLV